MCTVEYFSDFLGLGEKSFSLATIKNDTKLTRSAASS